MAMSSSQPKGMFNKFGDDYDFFFSSASPHARQGERNEIGGSASPVLAVPQNSPAVETIQRLLQRTQDRAEKKPRLESPRLDMRLPVAARHVGQTANWSSQSSMQVPSQDKGEECNLAQPSFPAARLCLTASCTTDYEQVRLSDQPANLSFQSDTLVPSQDSFDKPALGAAALRPSLPAVTEADVVNLFGAAALKIGHGTHSGGQTGSFRASLRSGVLALPTGKSGRVRILRLRPHKLRVMIPGSFMLTKQREPELDDSTEEQTREQVVACLPLLSSLRNASFGRMAQTDFEHMVLHDDSGSRCCPKSLLKDSANKCRQEGELYFADAFTLLHELLGDGAEQATDAGRLSTPTLQRISRWLARESAATVQKHLEQFAEKHATDSLEYRLEAVFHNLTANSVSSAMKQLRGHCSSTSFERLAGILAACGGSLHSSQARRSLAAQVQLWTEESYFRELMGQPLWRIYNLLSGAFVEEVEVAAYMLDWKTLVGACLWYRPRTDPTETSRQGELKETFACFDRLGSVARRSVKPAYARGAAWGFSKGRCVAIDLQYALLRGTAGCLDDAGAASFDVFDAKYYDYSSCSSQPLDVALPWHFCMFLRALGPQNSNSADAFAMLTQQYCFLLETSGYWEEAVYVARFLSDNRARRLLVSGIFLRNSGKDAGRHRQPLASAMDWLVKSLRGTSKAWLLQAAARRRESEKDWARAAHLWLQAADHERAAKVALGFLVPPVLLHSASTVNGDPLVVSFNKPNDVGIWLHELLQELSTARNSMQAEWAQLLLEVLDLFDRSWKPTTSRSAGDTATSSNDAVMRLCMRCQALREVSWGVL